MLDFCRSLGRDFVNRRLAPKFEIPGCATSAYRPTVAGHFLRHIWPSSLLGEFTHTHYTGMATRGCERGNRPPNKIKGRRVPSTIVNRSIKNEDFALSIVYADFNGYCERQDMQDLTRSEFFNATVQGMR